MRLLIYLVIFLPTHDNTLSSCILIAIRVLLLNLLILNLNNIGYNLKPENRRKERISSIVVLQTFKTWYQHILKAFRNLIFPGAFTQWISCFFSERFCLRLCILLLYSFQNFDFFCSYKYNIVLKPLCAMHINIITKDMTHVENF